MRASRLLAAFVLTAALAGPALGSPFDAFLKIEGVPGESKAPDRTGWIEVHSFQWVTPPPAPPPAPAPAGVARKQHGSITFVKRVDKASPLLSKAATAGKLLPMVIVEVPGTSAASQPYMRYEMKDVMISGYSMSGQGHGDPLPTEQVTFTYNKIELKYAEQKVAPKTGAAPKGISPVVAPISGVGAVSNPSPSTGGSDAATRSRKP